MAAAVDSAEGFLASKAGRALAFACSFTICLLAAGMLAITHHHSGPAGNRREYPQAAHHNGLLDFR
jgi:hypothetical protein